MQAAIARTQRQLPAEMTTPPSYRKVNPADAPILLLALQSDTPPLSKLDAFAQTGDLAGALDHRRRRRRCRSSAARNTPCASSSIPNALAARGIGIDEIQTADRGRQRQHAGRHAAEQRAAA